MAAFFTTLGKRAGSRQQENQLSSTFRACFDHSPVFRRVVLDTLARTCGIRVQLTSKDRWICDDEVAPPAGQGGRVDLRLSPPEDIPNRATQPVFHLESKVESKLTLKQLHRYRKNGVTHLVAVTKRPPEERRAVLAKKGIFALRWQDFHRELSAAEAVKAVDRFVIRSFVEYLEELDMAHPEQLTMANVESLGKLLRLVIKGNGTTTHTEGFGVGFRIVEFMRDIEREFVERNPGAIKFPRWGVGYSRMSDDWHEFGWQYYRKTLYKKPFVGAFLCTSRESETSPILSVYVVGITGDEIVKNRKLSMFTTAGALDRSKVVRHVEHWARKWKFV